LETHLPKAFDLSALVPYVDANVAAPSDVFSA
jgi:hypothetical protein